MWLLWSAPFLGESGYAEEARSALVALHECGYEVGSRVIGLERPATSIDSVQSRALEQRTALSPARKYAEVVHLYNTDFQHTEDATWKIWRTMFETTSLPDGWVEVAEKMDQVWVPSEFNVATFVRAGLDESKLRVIPQVVDTARFSPASQRVARIDNRCSFLSVFRWQQRKGWDILIRAFLQEFSSSDQVKLVIRAAPFQGELASHDKTTEEVRQDWRQQLEDAIGSTSIFENDRIRIVNQWLTSQEMVQLYRSADCYVLPTRGEGWGRPYMEAMAAGLPVIATGWGGHLEFMNDDVAYLVGASVRPVSTAAQQEYPLFANQEWAEPDIRELRDIMRWIYEHPADALEKGNKARAWILKNYSYKILGRAVQSALADLHTS